MTVVLKKLLQPLLTASPTRFDDNIDLVGGAGI
jgi:hypothetical protein